MILQTVPYHIARNSGGQTAGIVGGVAAIVIVGLILTGVLIYVRTRRNKRFQSSEYETTQMGSNQASDLHLYAGLNERGNVITTRH
ncbi:hypothetical protein DPMN_152665 [Dreissena polymorpha]|uniref:Uncharacterized protein n=1 Tax=Dreissena polymorpha TaxID=45954 RepID=A0A9D4FIQ4_DREPO|nr:hypothetical protein DPMN_152665 [Dreissena polymorpha]